MDAALAGLRSGLILLPRDLQNQALSGKFENPMLGMFAAYSLLADAKANVSLINIVLGNLERMLPGSSDVSVLKVLAAQRLGKSIPKKQIVVPPMLRMGLEAIMRAAAMDSSLVPEGSLIDRIATRLTGNSVWSQWEEPQAVVRTVTKTLSDSTNEANWNTTFERFDLDDAASADAAGPLEGGETGNTRFVQDVPDWLVNLVKDEAERRNSEVKKLDLEKLALEIGLPVRKLQQTADFIEVVDSIQDSGVLRHSLE